MNFTLHASTRISFVVLTFVCLACESRPEEPESRASAASAAAAKEFADIPAPAPQAVPVSAGDPLKGTFSLADATAGLDGKGKLTAKIQTSQGSLSCELWDDKAPNTVANFIGLARGTRPFQDPSGAWVKKPGYDGTTFHRIVRGFMIQGGDPSGTGAGQPGYVIADEIWKGAKHDRRGLLCMANRGPNTNGMQFFIMDGAAAHLDGGYTIFGQCSPEAVIDKLAQSAVRGDRAVDPPRIDKVTIARSH